MEITKMAISRTLIAVAAIVIIVVASFAVYTGVTYPRTILTVPVSITVGADVTNTQFDQPTLDNKVQVQISIQNGAALWRARILNGDHVIWEHAAAQGEQQSYNSGWLDLPSGTYNFTFATLSGSLDATATVSSKGGFW
jgi:hypothetical protein